MTSIDPNGEFGYWILVDTCPVRPEIAVQTDEYPLIINHKQIERKNLSSYSCSILEAQGIKYPSKVKKLVGTHEAQKKLKAFIVTA